MWMNSSSTGGLALAVSKSSVVQGKKTTMFSGPNLRNCLQKKYLVFFNLQRFAFYFSSYFSSFSGSARWRPPQSAAAWPWSSQCRQSSDWGSPDGGKAKFVKLFELQLETPSPKKCTEDAYHFSLGSQERDVRPAIHCHTRERRIQVIHLRVMALVLHFLPLFTLETHHPPLRHTKQGLCIWIPFTSLFPFVPTHSQMLSQHLSVSVLTSESGVRRGINRWRVRGVRDGGARDIIGVDHVSATLR